MLPRFGLSRELSEHARIDSVTHLSRFQIKKPPAKVAAPIAPHRAVCRNSAGAIVALALKKRRASRTTAAMMRPPKMTYIQAACHESSLGASLSYGLGELV